LELLLVKSNQDSFTKASVKLLPDSLTGESKTLQTKPAMRNRLPESLMKHHSNHDFPEPFFERALDDNVLKI